MKTVSKKTIQCVINGQEAKVKEGTSLIEAFKRLNQDICHYCWHPGLSVAGVCRLCMVEIEGIDKLQIACNTKVREGMRANNQSEKVKTAVRWGLEYHLINHPLDCPICDQAGECGLQDQYMKFGSYNSSMSARKVKKRKVVDLGPKIVLDTERCILCSRCVRFTNEVTKSHELGIFDRGDKSEIGVFKDRPLDNNYSENTVDICPVGALTSKDFRFRQRVWYLKTSESLCPGCSAGCNIYMDHNEEGLWRARPRFNEKVNGYWMCDKGRRLYKNSDQKARLNMALQGRRTGWKALPSKEALRQIVPILNSGFLQGQKRGKFKQDEYKERGERALSIASTDKKALDQIQERDRPVFILTGQYSNEEYMSLAETFPGALFYHWLNNENSFDDFDGLLLRGDRNPNTKGLKEVFPKIEPFKHFVKEAKNAKIIFVLGPECLDFYPDMEEKTEILAQTEGALIWMSVAENNFLPPRENFFQIPMKSFFEKDGTYTNHQGIRQRARKIQALSLQALSVQDFGQFLKGEDPNLQTDRPFFKNNQFLHNKRELW